MNIVIRHLSHFILIKYFSWVGHTRIQGGSKRLYDFQTLKYFERLQKTTRLQRLHESSRLKSRLFLPWFSGKKRKKFGEFNDAYLLLIKIICFHLN